MPSIHRPGCLDSLRAIPAESGRVDLPHRGGEQARGAGRPASRLQRGPPPGLLVERRGRGGVRQRGRGARALVPRRGAPVHAMRWPGMGRLSPMTTGPTGTKGGAKVGIWPLPITSITCCIGSHIRKARASTVAMASWSASYCFVLSLFLRPPSSASSIALAIEFGMQISVIIGEGQQMSGIGMFGIGGAIGPGKTTNAGYQGSPGTMTLSCHFLKHCETPFATASRCLALLPVQADT